MTSSRNGGRVSRLLKAAKRPRRVPATQFLVIFLSALWASSVNQNGRKSRAWINLQGRLCTVLDGTGHDLKDKRIAVIGSGMSAILATFRHRTDLFSPFRV